MNVQDKITRGWISKLREEILNCSANSHVGRRVVNYLQAVDIVPAMTEEIEPHEAIEVAAIQQCNVWYFG